MWVGFYQTLRLGQIYSRISESIFSVLNPVLILRYIADTGCFRSSHCGFTAVRNRRIQTACVCRMSQRLQGLESLEFWGLGLINYKDHFLLLKIGQVPNSISLTALLCEFTTVSDRIFSIGTCINQTAVLNKQFNFWRKVI